MRRSCMGFDGLLGLCLYCFIAQFDISLPDTRLEQHVSPVDIQVILVEPPLSFIILV